MNYFEEGNKLYGNKDYDKAIKCYEKVDKNDETYGTSLYNIGVCFVKKAEKENKEDFFYSAIEMFFEVLKENPEHYKSLYNISYAYIKLKEFTRAYIYANLARGFNMDEDPDCEKIINMLKSILRNK